MISNKNFDVILFCDGAVKTTNQNTSSATTCVGFNKNGVFIAGEASTTHYKSVILTEMEAIRQATRLASTMGPIKAFICSDSLGAIEAISADLEPPWQIETMVSEIRNLILSVIITLFRYLFM